MYSGATLAANLLRASSGPVFSHDFTGGTLPSGATFARSSTATYFNSTPVMASASTNTARYDHDPSSGAALGLLIEEARTNLVTDSDIGVWSTLGSSLITANATSSPTGSTDAAEVSDDNSGGTGVLGALKAVGGLSTTTQYASSVYAKAEGLNWFFFRHAQFTSPDGGIYFDVSTGSVGTSDTGFSGQIESLASSWFRPSVIWTTTTDTSGQMRFYPSTGDANPTVDIDGTSNLYFYGAQMEAGAFPTSHIPTSGGTATRAAETCITSSGVSAQFNAGSGLVVITFDSAAVGTRVIWQADDNTANNRFTVWLDGTTAKLDIVYGGTTQCSLSLGTVTAGTQSKIAFRYNTNDVAASLDGATAATDSSVTIPSVDHIRWGHDTSGNQLCGHLANYDAYDNDSGDVEALAA